MCPKMSLQALRAKQNSKIKAGQQNNGMKHRRDLILFLASEAEIKNDQTAVSSSKTNIGHTEVTVSIKDNNTVTVSHDKSRKASMFITK